MDLDELRAFLAVAETGSFLAAATTLDQPRATLRRRVESLEARAGVRLLERGPKGVILTAAGDVLALRGRTMVQETSALLSSLRELGSEPSGMLRVVLPVGLPPHVLTPLLGWLRVRYPKLGARLRFSEHPVGELLDDVDLAIHFGSRSPPGPWTSHRLTRPRQWLLASAAYLERRGVPRTIDELAGHDLLTWHAPDEDPYFWPARAGGRFAVDPVVISTDIHLVRQAIIAGHGIGLVPDAMLPDPGVPLGKLVPVLAAEVGGHVELRLVVPEALAELPKIRAVVQDVLGFVARIPVDDR
ncbi:LysR family transcriptional regulator [Nannocystaceae bacterium ST9]